MNNFGEKIKNLRRKMNLTQEELAERINVSYQAVSKWETNTSLPDITMFPILANFFNVTTDELLGVDLTKKQAKIDKIEEEYYRLGALGKEKEQFDFICQAYREYPNDYKILEHYIWCLYYDPYFWEEYFAKEEKGETLENPKKVPHKEELLKLCSRILNECVDGQIRYTAIDMLSSIYRDIGNEEKAIEYINLMPCELQNESMELLYDRGSEKWWEKVRKNIYSLSHDLYVKIRNCGLHEKSNDEAIRVLKKAASFLELIYDDGDYGFCHYDLGETYIWIANRYAWNKDYESSAKYLDLGLSHAKMYDELPASTVHTSFLVRGYEFKTSDVSSGFKSNNVKRELGYINESECYNDVRNKEWFKAIIDKYKPFAKDTK